MTNALLENRWKIYADGTWDSSLAVMQVSRAIGGGAVQSATFTQETEASNTGKRLLSLHQDYDPRANFAQVVTTKPVRIEITRVDAAGAEVMVHAGRLVAVQMQMSKSGEHTVFTSRFDHHLFSDGYPIHFTKFADHQIDYTDGSDDWTYGTEVDLDLELNPIVDGIPRQNCVVEEYVEDTETKYRAWPFHVDGVPTTWIDSAPATVQWWTLADAVHYLLRTYNASELHVTNPDRATLITQLGTDSSLIRNFKVPRGAWLANVLDKLLNPLGYNWMYSYTSVGTKPSLYFWKRNTPPPAGTARNIPLQRFDETVEINHLITNRSETEAYSITHDAFSRSCEQVKVQGGIKRYEITKELVPGWDPTHDSADVHTLVEGSPAMLANPKLAHVFRNWVLNEGGDYCAWAEHSDRKNGPYYSGMKFAHDLSAIFGTHIARRRKFKRLLTIAGAKKGSPAGFVSGIHVEIWDPDEDKWKSPYEMGLHVRILEDECGIQLGASSDAPFEVASKFHPVAVDPADSIKVKVTATLESDLRVEAETTPTANTLAEGKKLFLDVGEKHQFTDVSASSDFHGDASYDTREYDPTTDLENLSDHLLATWNASTVSGTISLLGTQIVGDYLGWEIAGLQFRNLKLTATHASILTPINPTVVAVTYDIPGNKTSLRLEAYRQDLRAY